MYDIMVDRISTDDSMLLKTVSPSFTSLNMHRHDSQTEINNYYINYIDDQLIQTELKTLEDRTTMSVLEENSCRLEVSELVEEVIRIIIKFNRI
jgi:hypothetical protein